MGEILAKISRRKLDKGGVQITAKIHDDLCVIAMIESATSHIKDKWNIELLILLPPIVAGNDWEQFRGVSYSNSCPLSVAECNARKHMDNLVKSMQIK